MIAEKLREVEPQSGRFRFKAKAFRKPVLIQNKKVNFWMTYFPIMSLYTFSPNYWTVGSMFYYF